MKRKIAAAVLLAALASSMLYAAAAVGPVVVLRPQNTLAASQTDSVTAAINCAGARGLVFLLRAAVGEADSLSNLSVQFSSDGVNWINSSVAGVAAIGLTVAGTGLNSIPKPGRIIAVSGSTSFPYIPWSWARLRFTSGNQIDSLSVTAWTLDETAATGRQSFQPPIQ